MDQGAPDLHPSTGTDGSARNFYGYPRTRFRFGSGSACLHALGSGSACLHALVRRPRLAQQPRHRRLSRKLSGLRKRLSSDRSVLALDPQRPVTGGCEELVGFEESPRRRDDVLGIQLRGDEAGARVTVKARGL